MKLVAVGKLKAGPELALFERYAARLRPALLVQEVPAARGSVIEQKRREAELLLAACPDNAFVVVLDEGGRLFDSPSFSKALTSWQESGRPIHFVIGGAEGLERSVLERADAVMSFGAMTWPHMLVRIMLAEQVFRAQAIATNHPYHKTSRPV
ncbi:hypothetical protein AA106555_1515 [Neokomagataea thailandica NBRC 106555]|uniref:Ribosomal RNA large subunit methyltransferase H n=2 Tax=Neokomagataea TaxID=1223423 RepID=A0A4Y6V8E4_9PROT|nr:MULTISPECIES: 23S rRNA (pseudouridine(1915)-N(3))-methyltransferase RlmH [Neokomagataea]QDH24635.1 23S rRNA (pseudouridine(1915)-N(3))-methyltransferase RlmH [Neokomagataea tanensis]GBR53991.1 hypothetical protein AA106555_1515 [Neokomagataea thailandica NBRC 106555]